MLAWGYMADVRNWDDPPAEFELDGPFEAGSRGITRMPGQEARYVDDRRTRLTQRAVLGARTRRLM